MWGPFDPGPCPVCGKAHTACTADAGPIAVVQLPARDAAVPVFNPVLNVADVVQAELPPGQFATGAYRRDKKKP